MFTGLVEDVGTLVAIVPQGSGRRLRLRTSLPLHEVSVGDSIAVDGACLTAETFEGDTFEVVAGRETLARTTLDHARVGRQVHLERALRLGDRLDGHLVQGHVDCIGRVVRSWEERESWVVWIEVPAKHARYVAVKGSICLDGLSLTVNEVSGTTFRVNLVPHTRKVTLLHTRRPGDPVNVEVDVIAKYVERLLGRGELGPKALEILGARG